MRVIIAAWHLKNFNVGIRRYCRGLIEGIAAVDHENRYDVLMPAPMTPGPASPNVRYA